MLTKGIIKSKTPNGYYVRIPYLETTSTGPLVFLAQCASEPPVSEAYAPNDVVYVGFEDHNADKPVIVGRLPLPLEGPRASATLQSLSVGSRAVLPEDTTIGGISAKRLSESARQMAYLTDLVSTASQAVSIEVGSVRVPTGNTASADNAAAEDTDGSSEPAMHGEVSVAVRVVGGSLQAGDEICVCSWQRCKDSRTYTSSDGSKKTRYRIRYRMKPCAVHVVSEDEVGNDLFNIRIPYGEKEDGHYTRAQNFYRTTNNRSGALRCVRVRRKRVGSDSRNRFETISNIPTFRIVHWGGGNVNFW